MKRAFTPATLIALVALLMQCMGGLGADVSALIQQGDPYDQKFQPKEALGFYLAAEKLDPKNVDLLLRIARQYRHLSADDTKPSEKMRLAELGKSYAERAVALAPNDAEAHLSVAISDVKMLGLLGTKEKLEASRRVKSRVDKVLALDPAKDLAWYVLGCWHQRLADIGMVKRAMAKLAYGSVPTATNDDAVKCFKKAIDLNPDRLIHYVELGRTYAQMGKKPEARQYIEKGLAMPNVGKDDPDIKQSGRETLSKIK